MHEREISWPVNAVHWRPSYRIVPSRFPPIDLFEGVADNTEDRALLNELEGMTSSRLREAAGAIHLVRDEDRRFGPGWSPIMAAFCYPSPAGSRFTDGSFGVYYCAHREATAIAETRFHLEQFLRESSQPPMLLEQRVYQATLRADLLDLRQQSDTQALLDPDDWSAAQTLGRQAWGARHYGIVYPSVRDPDGECAAILRPPALSPARQGRHLGYQWDGTSIRHVLEIRQVC